MKEHNRSLRENIRIIRRLLFLQGVMLAGVMVYFGKDIIMPITLGLLITLALTPPTRVLMRYKLPSALAALLVILSVGGVLGVGVYMLRAPMTELIQSFPQIGDRVKAKLLPYQESIEAITEASKEVEEIAAGDPKGKAQKVVIDQPGLISTAASSFANGLTSIALAMIFSFFMLSSGRLFYEKIVSIMPVLSQKKKALRVIFDVEENVSRYLFTISLINALLGLIIGSLLHVYGFPSAALWGVIAAVFNFLPFVGALIGAGMLAAVSMGVHDTMGAALIPPAIYLACTTIEGNFLTPLIVGRRLELNVVAVFLAVAIWGWLWGIAGALMAVPILVVVKVMCDHVENWNNFGEFLSARVGVRSEKTASDADNMA